MANQIPNAILFSNAIADNLMKGFGLALQKRQLQNENDIRNRTLDIDKYKYDEEAKYRDKINATNMFINMLGNETTTSMLQTRSNLDPRTQKEYVEVNKSIDPYTGKEIKYPVYKIIPKTDKEILAWDKQNLGTQTTPQASVNPSAVAKGESDVPDSGVKKEQPVTVNKGYFPATEWGKGLMFRIISPIAGAYGDAKVIQEQPKSLWYKTQQEYPVTKDINRLGWKLGQGFGISLSRMFGGR